MFKQVMASPNSAAHRKKLAKKSGKKIVTNQERSAVSTSDTDTARSYRSSLTSRRYNNRRLLIESVTADNEHGQERSLSRGGNPSHNKRPTMERRRSMDYSSTLLIPTTDSSTLSDSGEIHRQQRRRSFSFQNALPENNVENSIRSLSSEIPLKSATEMFAQNNATAAKKSTLSTIAPTLKFTSSNTSQGSEKTPPKVHPVVEALLRAMEKDHMLDLTLCGKEGVEVKVSRFVLACRNEALEELFYKEDPPAMSVHIGDYDRSTIKALVEYCVTGELALSPYANETVDAARGLVHLAVLAQVYHFRALYDETYQMARKLMNRQPPLAYAMYDEATRPMVKDFELYAIQTIEQSPPDTFLRTETGIQHLCEERLEQLLSHSDFEVDEITVFRILSTWVEHQNKSPKSMEFAITCASKINLQCIDQMDLHTSIKESGFFANDAIDNAIRYLDMMDSIDGLSLSHSSRGRQREEVITRERIIVAGAGNPSVNGIYIRENIEDQDENSIQYTKEGKGTDVYALYLWGHVWGIALEIDLSNAYYQCEQTSKDQVPVDGWTTGEMGQHPPPTCQRIAAKHVPLKQSNVTSNTILPACFTSEEDFYGN